MIVYILRVREWWRESEDDCVHTASETMGGGGGGGGFRSLTV